MSDSRQERAELLKYVIEYPKQAVLRVYEIPEADPHYATVLLELPGDYSLRLSPVDAQRLGHAINSAGGGVLPEQPSVSPALKGETR